MKQIAIILDEVQIEKIDEIADRFHQSRNFMIREALNSFINSYLQSKLEPEEKIEVDQAPL